MNNFKLISKSKTNEEIEKERIYLSDFTELNNFLGDDSEINLISQLFNITNNQIEKRIYLFYENLFLQRNKTKISKLICWNRGNLDVIKNAIDSIEKTDKVTIGQRLSLNELNKKLKNYSSDIIKFPNIKSDLRKDLYDDRKKIISDLPKVMCNFGINIDNIETATDYYNVLTSKSLKNEFIEFYKGNMPVKSAIVERLYDSLDATSIQTLALCTLEESVAIESLLILYIINYKIGTLEISDLEQTLDNETLNSIYFTADVNVNNYVDSLDNKKLLLKK